MESHSFTRLDLTDLYFGVDGATSKHGSREILFHDCEEAARPPNPERVGENPLLVK